MTTLTGLLADLTAIDHDLHAARSHRDRVHHEYVHGRAPLFRWATACDRVGQLEARRERVAADLRRAQLPAS